MSQLALRMPGPRVAVELADVVKQPSGAAAIALCATRSGKLDKISLLPRLTDTESQALFRAAHAFNAFPGAADEALRLRRLEHVRECLAECDRIKTPDEIERAIERATQDGLIEGRREPEPLQLTLAE